MASPFQRVSLVASPSYPNAIAWSPDNLIAVAAAHLVIILNPALPFGPRGLIRIPTTEPYPIGRVQRHDLLTAPLLPTALSRDRRPCVRSISWSQIGMAPNYGCLLAVCTIEGLVKIYRPPFCDFCAEWIEVTNISDMLYEYLGSTNFGENYKIRTPTSELAQVSALSIDKEPRLPCLIEDQPTEQGCDDNLPKSSANHLPNSPRKKECKRGRMNVCTNISKDPETFEDPLLNPRKGENTNAGSRPHTRMGRKRSSKVFGTRAAKLETDKPEKYAFPLVTADQYAYRSGMLSSLVVAWSPVLWLSSKICSVPQNGSSSGFSILAVGGKSGKISLWRIHAPQCYSIEHGKVSTAVVLVGLIQAHNSWITTINLALLGSKSQVLLASGSSDGSVKIWLGNGEELLKSSEVNNPPFFLLKEVISVNAVPVSVLSLAVPVHSLNKMLLAVGKGSGSFEVWTCDASGWKFDKAGSYDAHDCVVTGLAWAFDGCCLYSCGQDNYVRSWVLCGSSLYEVSIPSNIPGQRSSSDLPNVFLSCLGVAMSSGNLMVALVRNLDGDQLDKMYEARLQKAIVEFFWIGGQQLDMLLPATQDFRDEAFLGFPANELVCWESNILWSLKKYENLDEPLVIWDIIAALLAFKQSIPMYVDHLLLKWLSKTYLSSQMDLSLDEALTRVPKSFSKVTSRQLHLLNIICRRIILSQLKADEINCNEKLRVPVGAEGEHPTLWMHVLFSSERELRERLVGFSFSAFISHMSDSAATFSQPGYWYPCGVAQMKQWVALNCDHVRDRLKVLASEVGKHERRLHSSEYGVEEQCIYCSASVPFDSPEVASCHYSQSSNAAVKNHKLERCAVSMKVCPIEPLWFCKCCHRRVSKLPPETLFTMPRYPLDSNSLTESPAVGKVSKPLCPFCGILLQRLQADFFLSISPV